MKTFLIFTAVLLIGLIGSAQITESTYYIQDSTGKVTVWKERVEKEIINEFSAPLANFTQEEFNRLLDGEEVRKEKEVLRGTGIIPMEFWSTTSKTYSFKEGRVLMIEENIISSKEICSQLAVGLALVLLLGFFVGLFIVEDVKKKYSRNASLIMLVFVLVSMIGSGFCVLFINDWGIYNMALTCFGITLGITIGVFVKLAHNHHLKRKTNLLAKV